MILNKSQAEAVYSAMCALNNVGGKLCCRLDGIKIEAWEIVYLEGPEDEGGRVLSESYDDQAEFANAYGVA